MLLIGCIIVALVCLIVLIVGLIALDPERGHSGFDVNRRSDPNG